MALTSFRKPTDHLIQCCLVNKSAWLWDDVGAERRNLFCKEMLRKKYKHRFIYDGCVYKYIYRLIFINT